LNDKKKTQPGSFRKLRLLLEKRNKMKKDWKEMKKYSNKPGQFSLVRMALFPVVGFVQRALFTVNRNV